MSFGLRNQRGSCWVNATLQAIFRIPDVQTRYTAEAALETSPVDVSLQEIWSSRGEEGLKPSIIFWSALAAGEEG